MRSWLAVVIIFALFLPGCGGKPAPAVIKKDTQIRDRTFESLSPNLFIVPVNHDASSRKKPMPFDVLLRKVSEDKDCLSLAGRLFWNLPVELVPVTNDDDVKAVPKEKSERLYSGPPFVYIRVRATTVPSQSTENLLAGMLSLKRLSLRESQQAAPASEKNSEPTDDQEFLILLFNDYLLRHDADWIVVQSQDREKAKATKFELEEAKADQEKRINDYIQKFVMPAKP